MKPPPRNIAASVHQRLKNAAAQSGERFNDLLQHYALERFLCRLAASPYRDRFVLKGALMLRVWEVSSIRPTRDIDLLGRTANEFERIAALVRDICNAPVDADGLTFDAGSVVVARIAEEAEYDGVRATFNGRLGNARIAMQVDIGFGDRVTPEPVEIEYPSVLGMPRAKIIGYTPETTIAEKLHVMLQRGTFNSRMKDFFDIWAISQARSFDGRLLSLAVRATCERREPASRGAILSGESVGRSRTLSPDSETFCTAEDVPDLAFRTVRTRPRARMLAISARRSATVMVSGLRVESTARSGIEKRGSGVRHARGHLESPMPCGQPMRAFFTKW
ncbi:MAG: nucleotidyl transferase AbiEii/AbiGii toxin family protein [Planctomycetota bacterium]|nr:nucleotidyl transferase AbiEii/AbiGii toxin family protein [Planctomycetota bacterium]